MKQSTIRIPFNFIPRKYQRPLWNAICVNGKKRAVSIWHRRAGKDKTMLNIVVAKALQRVGVYFYFFPTYSQAKKILWDGIDKDGFKFLDHIPKQIRFRTLQSSLQIELYNDSIIQLIGTDNYDSIMGSNPVGCIFSEFSLQNPKAWDFIRPILSENGGWAIFNYTPRGRNHGYTLYAMAKNNPDWFCELLTATDTGAISQEQIQSERDSGMSEDMIQQEFFCSFDAAVPGCYFAKEIKFIRDNGQLWDKQIYAPELPVNTAWDLGMDDATAIWFFQNHGEEIRLLDYYEQSGEGLQHYASVLDERANINGWRYNRHIAPHDIEVRELGTGQSRKDSAAQLGISFETMPRVANKLDGIEATRKILKNCHFYQPTTQRGLDCLASYHKEFNDKRQVFENKPCHDWASHAADAMQTLALSINTTTNLAYPGFN